MKTFEVKYHLEKKDVRKEWHEITERGRKILQILEDLTKVVEEISLEDVHKKN